MMETLGAARQQTTQVIRQYFTFSLNAPPISLNDFSIFSLTQFRIPHFFMISMTRTNTQRNFKVIGMAPLTGATCVLGSVG